MGDCVYHQAALKVVEREWGCASIRSLVVGIRTLDSALSITAVLHPSSIIPAPNVLSNHFLWPSTYHRSLPSLYLRFLRLWVIFWSHSSFRAVLRPGLHSVASKSSDLGQDLTFSFHSSLSRRFARCSSFYVCTIREPVVFPQNGSCLLYPRITDIQPPVISL